MTMGQANKDGGEIRKYFFGFELHLVSSVVINNHYAWRDTPQGEVKKG